MGILGSSGAVSPRKHGISLLNSVQLCAIIIVFNSLRIVMKFINYNCMGKISSYIVIWDNFIFFFFQKTFIFLV